MKKLKYKAFTLAEVLLTLVIIGIVAALTVPAILADIKNKEFKSAWKKAYSDLSQATTYILNENSGSLVNVFANNNDLSNKYLSHLNYKQQCDDNISVGNCWHNSNTTTYLYGATKAWSTSAGGVLNNGSILYFKLASSDCTQFAGIDYCGIIAVDLNGKKHLT